MAVFQPHVGPGLAAIRALENARAPVGTAAGIGFTATGPNRFRLPGLAPLHGDGAERKSAFMIEKRGPIGTFVFRVPKSAGSEGHDPGGGPSVIGVEPHHAPTLPQGPDTAEGNGLERASRQQFIPLRKGAFPSIR